MAHLGVEQVIATGPADRPRPTVPRDEQLTDGLVPSRQSSVHSVMVVPACVIVPSQSAEGKVFSSQDVGLVPMGCLRQVSDHGGEEPGGLEDLSGNECLGKSARGFRSDRLASEGRRLEVFVIDVFRGMSVCL